MSEECVEAAKEDYRVSRNTYHNKISYEKLKNWKEFVNNEGNTNPWGIVYKLIMEKITIGKALTSIKTVAGDNETLTYLESVSRLLEELLPDDKVDEYTLKQKQIVLENESYINEDNVDEFTTDELDIALGQLKNKKAPGEDGITNELLREVVYFSTELILKIFNYCLRCGTFPKIWKEGVIKFLVKSPDKDKTLPRSYRPICLLPTLGKLLERMVAIKIMKWGEGKVFYNERQYGFVKRRSTVDAVKRVMKIVEESKEKYVGAILFDVQGAFDSLWWPSLFKRLRELGCPNNLYTILKSYLNDRKVKVECGTSNVEKMINKGCPQGSVLGPILWNLNYDAILEALDGVNCEAIAYADDLIVIGSGSSRAQLERNLQIIIDVVEKEMDNLNLKLSIGKTEALLLKGRLNENRSAVIKLYNNKIKFVKTCKYLGIQLENGLTFISHAKQLKSKLIGVSGKLLRVVANSWGLNQKTLKLLYKGIFVPILTYGAPCWYDKVEKITLMKILTSAQRPFLLLLTKGCRTVSSPALQVLAGVLPADLQIIQRGLQYENKKGLKIKWKELNIQWCDNDIQEKGIGQLRKDTELMIKDEIFREWQERWTRESKGRVTYEFVKDVDMMVKNDFVHLCYEVTCFLTGHGFFRANLCRFGLDEASDCACGEEQTSNHLLWNCPISDVVRLEVLDGMVPSGPDWYLKNKENYKKFMEIAKGIFGLHRNEEI